MNRLITAAEIQRMWKDRFNEEADYTVMKQIGDDLFNEVTPILERIMDDYHNQGKGSIQTTGQGQSQDRVPQEQPQNNVPKNQPETGRRGGREETGGSRSGTRTGR